MRSIRLSIASTLNVSQWNWGWVDRHRSCCMGDCDYNCLDQVGHRLCRRLCPPASSSYVAILLWRSETRPTQSANEIKVKHIDVLISFSNSKTFSSSSVNKNRQRIRMSGNKYYWNFWLTCNTRFGRPVFCDNCFRSFASGLWLIEKYDFIVRNWWCLNEVRIRLARDAALSGPPRPKPKSKYSELRSANKRMKYSE